MRAVVQRVTGASVEVGGGCAAAIGPGLLVLLGVEESDTPKDRAWMAEKIAHLRVFEDEQGKMNRSVLEVGGAVLLVPNFTVAGDARKGRRPSFDNAMRPERSEGEFAEVARAVAAAGVEVRTGVFRAHMRVSLVNDGPVTIWLDSAR